MLEQYFSKMSWSEIGIPEGIPLFCFLWHLAISFGLVHFDPCFILTLLQAHSSQLDD